MRQDCRYGAGTSGVGAGSGVGSGVGVGVGVWVAVGFGVGFLVGFGVGFLVGFGAPLLMPLVVGWSLVSFGALYLSFGSVPSVGKMASARAVMRFMTVSWPEPRRLKLALTSGWVMTAR